MSRSRRLRLSGVAFLTLLVGALCMADSIAAAPLAHRSTRKSQPTQPTRAAPDQTATIPERKAPAVDDETIPTPFNLPAAPRTKVRACGEKWQALKMAGLAGDQTWREFATECLVKDEASQKQAPQKGPAKN